MVIPAWLEHDRGCVSPTNCAYIHFDLVGLSRFQVNAISPSLVQVPVRESYAGGLRQWLDRVESGRGESLEGLCFAKGLILLVLGEILQQLPPERLSDLRRLRTLSPRLHKLLQVIERDLAGDLSNTTLASSQGMSPETLIAGFKKQLGVTPAQYVLEQRVKKAAERLAFTIDSLETIAEDTGFADRQHLSKVFHKRMGLPPARYRKMNREI
jgi:AraC-like DNA-binding protein